MTMAQVYGNPNIAVEVLQSLGKKIASGRAVRVGFLESATHSNADGSSMPTATIAALNNFGSETAPPRPFFTNMVRDKSGQWSELLASALRASDNDGRRALGLLGEHIAGDLRASIVETMAPALSPITVMLRAMKSEDQNLIVTGATVGEAARRVARGESTGGASTKPLVETGQMLNAVDYEVGD